MTSSNDVEEAIVAATADGDALRRDCDDADAADDDEEEEYVSVPSKRMKATVDELICPISHELLVDPVVAEDGELYEREEIERLIEVQGNSLRSPMTNKKMGKALIAVIRVRNTVEKLVESRAITGELATSYKQRKKVLETKKLAKNGDVKAMESLAEWYRNGSNGVSKNEELSNKWDVNLATKLAGDGYTNAMNFLGYLYHTGKMGVVKNLDESYKWFKKSADSMDTKGIAHTGYFLLNGTGIKTNSSHGMALIGTAALLGSDYACYKMAEGFDKGKYGLPIERQLAKTWYKKVIDDSCSVKHLTDKFIDISKTRLEELEKEDQEPSNG